MEQGRPVTPEWTASVPGSWKGPATAYDDPKPTKSEGVSDKPKDDAGDFLTGTALKGINAQFDFAFTDDNGASHEVSIFACYKGFQGCIALAAILDGSFVILRSGKWDCSYQANALRFSVDLRRKKGKLRCGSREFGFLSIKEGDEIEKNRITGSPLGPRNELIRDSVHNMGLRGLGRAEAPSSVRSGMKPIAVGVSVIVGFVSAVGVYFVLAFLAVLLSAGLPAVPIWLEGICAILAIGAVGVFGKTVYFFFAACFPEKKKNGDRQEPREDKA
jgi:hypothetical protein